MYLQWKHEIHPIISENWLNIKLKKVDISQFEPLW